MLSSYMGRWLTLFVTIAVILIAVSAIFSGGLGSRRDIIKLCVPAGLHAGESIERFEPLRALLSRESRRPVVLVECADRWPADFDLFVAPVGEYLRQAEELPIAALFEVGTTDRHPDKAILVAGPASDGMDPPAARAGEIAFTDPQSVNGFWLQADHLEQKGVALEGEGFCFEGTPDDGTPVIYSVLHGKYLWGACKFSELAALTDKGILESREVRVVYVVDALPEIVIGAREADSSYYSKKLGAVAALLRETELSTRRDNTVDLLKSNGIRRLDPVSSSRMERVTELFYRFEAGARADGTIRP